MKFDLKTGDIVITSFQTNAYDINTGCFVRCYENAIVVIVLSTRVAYGYYIVLSLTSDGVFDLVFSKYQLEKLNQI